MRSDGRTIRRLKKLRWAFHRPEWTVSNGIELPVKHSLISSHIGREIFLGDYEKEEMEIVSKRLSHDDIVLEVGTGLGFISAYCAKRVDVGRVFTYEANPTLIPLIRETYQRNHVSPTLTNALLGPGTGQREFHVDAEFWASSAHRRDGRAIMIEQLDLNSELARVRPTFLIVDIEGGEVEFFAGADLSSVRSICVETHPAVVDNRALSGMFAALMAKGFVVDFSLIRNGVFYLSRDA